MGGNALKSLGIRTETKTTDEMLDIFSDIKRYISGYEVTIPRFYRNKKTHGDLDVLIKTDNKKNIFDIAINIKDNGYIINGDVISFDYRNFQIDFICIRSNIWNTAIVYYSYDPFANIVSKIAKGFGAIYGMSGLYYRFTGITSTKIINLSRDNREIFNFLGYDFSQFKDFNTIDDILDYVTSGRFFDKDLFQPENLTSMDRKRSMKRKSYRYFLSYIENKKSNYKFSDNKSDYISYIDSFFSGFASTLSKYIKQDKEKFDTNSKIRKVYSKFKSGKLLGDVIMFYKMSKDNYTDFIKQNDVNYLYSDFKSFYIRYKELDSMIDKRFGFGKKMGNDVYIHKDYSSYIPQDIYLPALNRIPKEFDFTVLKYNRKTNSISFIKSDDFDTASEPTVGDSIKVDGDEVKLRNAPSRDQIYHHKWMFVKPDYDGFDYIKSKLHSLMWYKKYDYDYRLIGYKDYWNSIGISESYKDYEIEIANNTSRTYKGRIWAKAVVPQYVEKIASKNDLILDYGSGKYPLYTIELREKGFNVKSWDFGKNITGDHDIDALKYKYDIVFASNVLNVQSSINMLVTTIKQIIGLMKDDGIFIANYPYEPRKMDMTFKDMASFLSNYFHVKSVGKNIMSMTLKDKSRYVETFMDFTINKN